MYGGVDNYFALNVRFHKRIQNFRDLLRNGQDTVFVCSHTVFTEQTRELLLQAADCLQRRTVGNSAVLAVVTGACEADLSDAESEAVRILELPLPSPGYTFHSPEDYMSVVGVAFEQTIVSATTDLAATLAARHYHARFAYA